MDNDHTTCPFCLHENANFSFSVQNEFGNFWIYLCQHCQTEFSAGSSNQVDDLLVQKHFFDEDLYTIANLEKVHKYWRTEVKRINDLGYNGGRVLDIGCNTGEFLFCLGNTGWEKYGIEIADVPAKMAEEKGITIYKKPLEELHLPSESFDIVTLYALIEHLNDPQSLVKEVARILKKNGLAVIMTGDRTSTKARILGKKWHMYIPPLHQFFFSRKSFIIVLPQFSLNETNYHLGHGGMTFFKNKLLKLIEKASLWQFFSLPGFKKIPFYDHYYGYFKKS